MNKKDQQALEELQAYLASRSEKTNRQSDKVIIGNAQRKDNHPTWYKNVKENTKTKETHPEWHAKITQLNQTRKERHGPDYSKKLSEGQRRRFENLSEEEKQAIKEKHKQQANDPAFKQRMRQEVYDTVEWREAHAKQIEDLKRNETWRKNSAKARQKTIESKEWLNSVRVGVAKRTASEDWIRKNCRPVKCPYGIFPVVKHATLEYQKEHGGELHSLSVKIRSWLKSENKPEWQYLTWEEYDEQTR